MINSAGDSPHLVDKSNTSWPKDETLIFFLSDKMFQTELLSVVSQ